MQIRVETNIPQLRRQLGIAEKQVRFAIAVALTKTAQDVQREAPGQMERDLDRPTDFTKRGLYIQAARRDNLVSVVGFKDRQAKYMVRQIEGGTYRPGPGGIRLPGDVKLNAFGNIPRGLIDKLKAAAKDGSLGKAVARRLGANGDRRKNAAPVQLFLGKPQGKGWEDAPMGIWRRIPPSTPAGRGKLVPVIVFEDTPATYEPRFDFLKLGQRIVAERFGGHLKTALANAMRTAR